MPWCSSTKFKAHYNREKPICRIFQAKTFVDLLAMYGKSCYKVNSNHGILELKTKNCANKTKWNHKRSNNINSLPKDQSDLKYSINNSDWMWIYLLFSRRLLCVCFYLAGNLFLNTHKSFVIASRKLNEITFERSALFCQMKMCDFSLASRFFSAESETEKQSVIKCAVESTTASRQMAKFINTLSTGYDSFQLV